MSLLIPDVHQAHRFYSVIAASLLAGFDSAVALLPTLRDYFSAEQLAFINAGCAIAIVVLRVLRQDLECEQSSQSTH